MKRTTVELSRAERGALALLEIEHDITFRELLGRFARATLEHKAEIEQLLHLGPAAPAHASAELTDMDERFKKAETALRSLVTAWTESSDGDEMKRRLDAAGRGALAAVAEPWPRARKRVPRAA